LAKQKMTVPQADIDAVDAALRSILDVYPDIQLLQDCGVNCDDIRGRLDKARAQLEAFKVNTVAEGAPF
jgi:hypothetical protein